MRGNWEDFMSTGSKSFLLKEFAYGENPDQKIYLSLPKERTSFPMIVWYHGGGLIGGVREIPDSLFTGEYGIAEVRYRLSGNEFNGLDSIDDAVKSLVWILEHIESLGGNPEKIIIGGMSAGSYLAALVGMAPHLLGKYGYDNKKLAGLVLVSGQMSTHFQLKKDLNYHRQMWNPVIDEYAPLYYASPDLPPCIFITGDFGCDMPTRAEENAYFASVLRALGHKDARHYSLGGHDHSGAFESCGWLCLQFVNRIFKG